MGDRVARLLHLPGQILHLQPITLDTDHRESFQCANHLRVPQPASHLSDRDAEDPSSLLDVRPRRQDRAVITPSRLPLALALPSIHRIRVLALLLRRPNTRRRELTLRVTLLPLRSRE
jgi:hypothetical protein